MLDIGRTLHHLIFRIYVTVVYWLNNPTAILFSTDRLLKQRLYFPFWIYSTLVGLMFFPLYVQAFVTQSDLTGMPLYVQTLAFANPFLDRFNDPEVFYPYYTVSFGLSFLYAYKRLKGKQSTRIMTALSWAGFMITVGLFGILGSSLGIINFLTHQEWQWVVYGIAVAVFVSSVALVKSLPKWSQEAISFS